VSLHIRCGSLTPVDFLAVVHIDLYFFLGWVVVPLCITEGQRVMVRDKGSLIYKGQGSVVV
jgi:hypothetical protein